jgi:hypothetical protein
MVFEFRFRPFILLPTLTDDVRAAAKALTTSEGNKSPLQRSVALIYPQPDKIKVSKTGR